MAVFSFLFGNGTSKRTSGSHPFPGTSSSSSSYPPRSSTSRNGQGHGDEYDDVALGTSSGGTSSFPPSRSSFSAPTATDGSFVGSSSNGSYSVESSYPPLPSFSRPSSSSSNNNPGRYPPLAATFSRLEALLDAQSPLLLDSLSPPLPYGRRDESLLSLQSTIAPYVLPPAVVESYLLHDGQDSLASSRGGGGGAGGGAEGNGLVYGLWWLPLERVEEEWKFWRKLESAGGLVGAGVGGDAFSASVGGVNGGRAHPYRPEEEGRRGEKEEEGDLEGMSSFPPGWVRARYSHPGWLPLLTDRCGNYIGVDLDPPPPSPSSSSNPSSPSTPSFSSNAKNAASGGYGQPGQVIAFGREIDEKVVLFPGDGPGGWARWWASFVEDVERGEFARLGEKPAPEGGEYGGGGGGVSDEEMGPGGRRAGVARANGGGREGSSGSEEEGERVWGAEGDGIGERGYSEGGVYGEEVVGAGELGGSARSAQTWVLRAPYRRLAVQSSIEGGIIGLLCERSRRKWRSLGVGTRTTAANGRSPLSVIVPNGVGAGKRATTAVGVEVDGRDEQDEGEEPKSAATMKAGAFSSQQQENQPPSLTDGASSSSPVSPPLHPLDPSTTEGAAADASASTVELVLSPPSPSKRQQQPFSSSAASGSGSRTSHESSRSRASTSSRHSQDQYLQQPPRRSSGSSHSAGQNGRRVSRRPPPPPAAPLALPTFSELDFSDSLPDGVSPNGYAGNGAVPIPTATWLLNDGAERALSVSTSPGQGGLMSRLSFTSSNGPTPTRESLLPTSRPPSVHSTNSFQSSHSSHASPHTAPVPLSPPQHSTIPIHTREATDEYGEDVPLHASSAASRSTTALVGGGGEGGGEGSGDAGEEALSPPTSPEMGGGERFESIVVLAEKGWGGGEGIRRTASPADEPYGRG
ncbi:hypothetical protein JCM8547_003263 [Rhodosporidiobolus lusitaniae]